MNHPEEKKKKKAKPNPNKNPTKTEQTKALNPKANTQQINAVSRERLRKRRSMKTKRF